MASDNRSLPRIILCSALFASCLALAPSPGAAQDALAADAAERRVERARTLFLDGVAHVQARRFVEAETNFREALTLRDAAPIRYNLASVLFEQGEYPEARAMADSVLSDATTTDEVRAHTRELITQMDARAGYARIDVVGGEASSVELDGYRVAERSRELPLAPGAHVATASSGPTELAREQFEIATGERRVISLDVALAAETPEIPVARDEGDLAEQWWFWAAVGGGVVVVAVVVGVVVATSGGVQQPVQGDFDPGVLRW